MRNIQRQEFLGLANWVYSNYKQRQYYRILKNIYEQNTFRVSCYVIYRIQFYLFQMHHQRRKHVLDNYVDNKL